MVSFSWWKCWNGSQKLHFKSLHKKYNLNIQYNCWKKTFFVDSLIFYAKNVQQVNIWVIFVYSIHERSCEANDDTQLAFGCHLKKTFLNVIISKIISKDLLLSAIYSRKIILFEDMQPFLQFFIIILTYDIRIMCEGMKVIAEQCFHR